MKRISLLFLVAMAAIATAHAFRMETTYRMDNGKMVVSASINGEKGLFILDTGAPCTVTHSFAQRAHLAAGQSTQV